MAPKIARAYPWAVGDKNETPIKFLRDRVLANSWPIIRVAVKQMVPTDDRAYNQWLSGRARLHDSHITNLFEHLLLLQHLGVAAIAIQFQASTLGVEVRDRPDVSAAMEATRFDWDSLPKNAAQLVPFLRGVRTDLDALITASGQVENWISDAQKASDSLAQSHVKVNAQLIAHRSDGAHFGVLMESFIYNLIGFNISSGGATVKAARVGKLANDYTALHTDFIGFFEERGQESPGSSPPVEVLLQQQQVPVLGPVPSPPLELPEELQEALLAADIAEVFQNTGPALDTLSNAELEALAITKLESFVALEIL